MKRINQTQLYRSQVSLSEWFEKIDHKNKKGLRLEDSEKRDRLEVLHNIINLPFDKPTQFQAQELIENSPALKTFIKKHGRELCALRLVPLETGLPILRMRGMQIIQALKWFNEQQIDPKKYKADFVPHGDTQKWSLIFIVNKRGMFGEIIGGGHYQLTQGFYDTGEPITFTHDFKELSLSKRNKFLERYIKSVLDRIKVTNQNKKVQLEKSLGAKFTNSYIQGYFETVDTKEFGLWFIDYNRALGNLYKDFAFPGSKISKDSVLLTGRVGNPGKAKGTARVTLQEDINPSIKAGEILVCPMTTPDHIGLMKKSAAIITDMGGILSHASIVARELKKPCITATINATKVLKDGDLIEVDADNGVVRYAN